MRKLIAILAVLLVAAQADANGYGLRSSFRSYSFSSYRIATPYAPVAFTYAYQVPLYYPTPIVAQPFYQPYSCCQSQQFNYAPPVQQIQQPVCEQQQAYSVPIQQAYAAPVLAYSAYATAFPYVSSYLRSYNYGFQRAFFSRRAVIHGRGFRGSSFNGFAGGTAAVQVNNRGLFGRRQSVTAVAGGGAAAVQVNSRAGLFGRRQSVTVVGGAGGVAVVQQRGRIRR